MITFEFDNGMSRILSTDTIFPEESTILCPVFYCLVDDSHDLIYIGRLDWYKYSGMGFKLTDRNLNLKARCVKITSSI